MSKYLEQNGKTYILVEVGLGMNSYCNGCAFYNDEAGCNAANDDCIDCTGSLDTTFIWVENK